MRTKAHASKSGVSVRHTTRHWVAKAGQGVRQQDTGAATKRHLHKACCNKARQYLFFISSEIHLSEVTLVDGGRGAHGVLLAQHHVSYAYSLHCTPIPHMRHVNRAFHTHESRQGQIACVAPCNMCRKPALHTHLCRKRALHSHATPIPHQLYSLPTANAQCNAACDCFQREVACDCFQREVYWCSKAGVQREVYLSLIVLRGQILYQCQDNRMRACRAADVHDDDFRAGGRLASNAHTTRQCTHN